MSDPRGVISKQAGGKDYRLALGMSGIAELQAKHGQDVFQKLEANDGAMPNMAVIVDLVMQSLQRFHAAEADRYLADDLLAENGSQLVGDIIQASFPDAVIEDDGSGGKSEGAKG